MIGFAPHRYTVVVVISADRMEQARDLMSTFTDMVETRQPGKGEVTRTMSYDARLFTFDNEARK